MSIFKIFYDTETTGLPDFKAPSEAPHQPHIVQLAAALVNMETREIVKEMNVIIKPDGWIIPDDNAKIHGITTERALSEGIPELQALDEFLAMANGHVRVAHNEQFDARIVRIAIKRLMPNQDDVAEGWKAGKAECTARLATPILKLPPTPAMRAVSRFHAKTANLSESYKFFTGEPLEGAHSAMVDVMACIRVYFAIQDGVVVAADERLAA